MNADMGSGGGSSVITIRAIRKEPSDSQEKRLYCNPISVHLQSGVTVVLLSLSQSYWQCGRTTKRISQLRDMDFFFLSLLPHHSPVEPMI